MVEGTSTGDFITKQYLGIVAGILLGGIVILLILIVVLYYMVYKIKLQLPQSIPPGDQRYVPTSDRSGDVPKRNPRPPHSVGEKKFDTRARPTQPAQTFVPQQSLDLNPTNYSQYNGTNQNYGMPQPPGIQIPRPTAANSDGSVKADYYGGRDRNYY